MIADDSSPVDIAVYGEALLTRGLEVRGAIEGLGLESFGLIWSCPQIWTDTTAASGIATSWGPYSGISLVTNWSAYSGASLVTAWTPPKKGFNGEC